MERELPRPTLDGRTLPMRVAINQLPRVGGKKITSGVFLEFTLDGRLRE
jgi:hypothetical protein